MLPPRFFALTPGELQASDVDGFAALARTAFEAGLGGLMLREPLLSERDFLRLAQALVAHARARSAWICVHDRVHVALCVHADAVQLGFRSLPPGAARPLLRAGMSLGVSTHAGDVPETWAACDFRIHGPVFDTPSKRGWKAAIGEQALAASARSSSVPIWAIGGIRPEHAALLRTPALGGICARASVFERGDSPRELARKLSAWSAALDADSSPTGVQRP